MEYDATIMIPVFNSEKYLPECLESALNQTFKRDYEILVVNDGSTDLSSEILNEFAKKNKKIRVLNQENKGIGKTRNILWTNSQGKILIGLDSDDKISPKALEKVINFYNENSDLGFVYTNQRVIDRNNKILYEGRKEKCHKFFDELIYFSHFPGHLRSFRKEKITKNFNLFLNMAEDWDFLLQITPKIKKGHIPEFLYDYRLHPGNESKRNPKEINRKISCEILKKNLINNQFYLNAENIKVIPVIEGEHAIYYNHIVDGKLREMSPEAKEALIDYFSQYAGLK